MYDDNFVSIVWLIKINNRTDLIRDIDVPILSSERISYRVQFRLFWSCKCKSMLIKMLL